MKVKLFTRTGGFVTAAELPSFSEQPDVILWGDRVFCVPDVDRDLFVADLAEDEYGYVEAWAYTISPSTRVAPPSFPPASNDCGSDR